MHDLHTKEADLTEGQTDSTLRWGGRAGILGSILMLVTFGVVSAFDNVKAQSLSAVRGALTPTGTLIPNSGRGGRWVGPLLSEAAEALRYVGAGHTRGKVVVTV
jgi:hypothetical protein